MEKINPDTLPMIALYLSPAVLSNFISCNSNVYRFFNDVNILKTFSIDYLQKWFPNQLKEINSFMRKAIMYNHGFYLKMLCFYIFENRIDINNIIGTLEQGGLITRFLYDRHADFFKILIKKIIYEGRSLLDPRPLYSVAGRGDLYICEILIQNEVDINAKDDGGETALHNASYFGQYDICVLLIENGADVNIESDVGGTALGLARYKENQDICKLLIKSGAKK